MTKPFITWEDFQKVDIRSGLIKEAHVFPEARKPAYKLLIDFGDEIGLKKTSAQITDNYQPEDLIGMNIVAITNFPPKQIGPVRSEVLVLGTIEKDGKVVLLSPTLPSKMGSPVG